MITEATVKDEELNFDAEGIRKLSLLYRAVDHPKRMSIVKLIHVNNTMSVMEICIRMNLDKEIVSQQLGILRRAGLVHSVSRSRFRYYSLDYDKLKFLEYSFDS